MKATCPGCGRVFDVRKRPKGTGREVDPLKPLGKREAVLLEILARTATRDGWENWATVRSLQAYIFGNDVARVGRRDWNYVVIQSALADLLGRGLIASKAGRGQELLYRVKFLPPVALNESLRLISS